MKLCVEQAETQRTGIGILFAAAALAKLLEALWKSDSFLLGQHLQEPRENAASKNDVALSYLSILQQIDMR